MFLIRTLPLTLLFFASLFAYAAEETPSPKDNNAPFGTSNKKKGVNYTFHIDNKINKDNTIDSVWVILDKFDRSGAGIVKQVFYPNANNEVVIEDLPAGKYYAEVYVLGFYQKHFSAIISSGKSRKNKEQFKLDYKEVYTPGNASIPDENLKLFAYYKK